MSETAKVILFGNRRCGKTSLASRLARNSFSSDYKRRTGSDFLTTPMLLSDGVTSITIWDLGDISRSPHLLPDSIRHSDITVIVYDITDLESFLGVTFWVEEVCCGNNSEEVLVIVGTKSDLQQEREVSHEKGQAKAMRLGASFLEVSAKTGANLDALNLLLSKLVNAPKTHLFFLGDYFDIIATRFLRSVFPQASIGFLLTDALYVSSLSARVIFHEKPAGIEQWAAQHFAFTGCLAAIISFDLSSRDSLSEACKRLYLVRCVLGGSAVAVLLGCRG